MQSSDKFQVDEFHCLTDILAGRIAAIHPVTTVSPSKNWITMQKLENRRLMPGEKTEVYIQDVLQMANNVNMTENEQRAALIRGLSPKLRAQLITHNPQDLAETIERINLSETALMLQNEDSVNVVESMTTCQLAGIKLAVAELDSKINSLTAQPRQDHQQFNNPRCEPSQNYPPTPVAFVPRHYQGWGQVQYLYLVLVLKYIFIST